MRSDTVTKGKQQAPHRSLFNALGLTQEEMERPLVGIVSSYNEIVPGHMNLDKIVNAVKQGVSMAGGTPIVFPAIAVCDGIAMGHIGMKYSLVTRDLIADSTEAMAMAHQFDALVMVPNCDKNVPGLLMAAARINVPTVFVSGGPMMAGHIHGHKTSLSSMFEAVGSYAAGKISEEELTEDYKGKIASFVNNMPQWYSRAYNSIIAWAKDTYKIDAHVQDIELINIFVLFEQNEDELFGVEFRVEFDVEHGCGIKIKVDNGKYDIIEVGTGDVAFC